MLGLHLSQFVEIESLQVELGIQATIQLSTVQKLKSELVEIGELGKFSSKYLLHIAIS